VEKTKHKTLKNTDKFSKAQILASRTLQISLGAKCLSTSMDKEVDKKKSSYSLASREFDEGSSPLAQIEE